MNIIPRAVIVHLNTEAQTGKAYLASQALGVVSAICALSGLFILQLIMHTLGLVICSEYETVNFFEVSLLIIADENTY
jgi:hypothetical protein